MQNITDTTRTPICKNNPWHRCLLAVGLLLLLLTCPVNGQEFKLPSGSGAVDVTAFGANGSDSVDDTQAIQNAIINALDRAGRYSTFPMIYIPDGTYIVSDTLESRVSDSGWSYGWRAGMFIHGQSRTGTIIKLKNAAPGFTDSAVPKAVFKTGSENAPSAEGNFNQAFRHMIMNLTIDVGANNPGAVGVDLLVSNRGGLENVTIKSSDATKRGHTGIKMDRAWPGPGLIKDVSISGFDTGVSMMVQFQYGMTFEHLALDNQLVVGMKTGNNSLFIRGLYSNNTVPVLTIAGTSAQVVIIDSDFVGGASGMSGIDAISGVGTVFARNVRSSGYETIINDKTSRNRDVAGGASMVTLREYTSKDVLKPNAGNSSVSLNLPVEETPTFNTIDMNKWANVETYGATASDSSDDDRAGIQAAIDASGKEVVYLPNGAYDVSNTIVLRNGVRKLIGFHSALNAKSGFPSGAPLIRFDNGTPASVNLEFIRIGGLVEHNASRTLAIRHCDIGEYRNTSSGTGNFFLEDTIGPRPMVVNYPQRIWARQLNTEFGTATHLQINAGSLWVLSHKTEGSAASIYNVKDATMEVLGGFYYPNSGNVPASLPMLTNDNSKVSASYKMNLNHYDLHYREIRGGLSTVDITHAIAGGNVALLSGNVSRIPSLWAATDVGSVGFFGTEHNLGSLWTVSGSGAYIWNSADGFRYVYQQKTGDCTITAKVLKIGNTDAFAKAGVMIRETLASNSRHGLAALNYSAVSKYYYRTSTGENSGAITITSAVVAPHWVRLRRVGSTLTAYHSSDGVTWSTTGSRTIAMASSVYVGLAVTASNNNAVNTSDFSNVTITTP